MYDKVTVIFALGLIISAPIVFLYILSLPEIPCDKWPKDTQSDCMKLSPEELKSYNSQSRWATAIIISSLMWPYGVYYLFQRQKEIKQQKLESVQ